MTAVRAEELDPALVAGLLDEGDVLFVDTTHTVKTGGDVDHIFSALIPRLVPGVWVHIHDVFLPFEYPRMWVVDDRRLWAEQYLVHAFLAFNSSFRVRFPAMAVSRAVPDTVAELVPGFSLAARPGAFWIERVSRPQGKTARLAVVGLVGLDEPRHRLQVLALPSRGSSLVGDGAAAATDPIGVRT